MIGEVLADRYRLDAELGRGGMGTVYRGFDLLLRRPVAIKVLTDTGLGTQGRSRLLREAQMAAQLNHPNIVSIYDAGQTAGADGSAPFIVMELVDGHSLHEERPDDIMTVLAIARQVCAALQHAHTHGIIHRDLKPENVLLTVTADRAPAQNVIAANDGGNQAAVGLREPSAKLTDFGLARSLASRMTGEGTITGTVFYMAPEQALGSQADGRADLYALGVMLYELVSGRLPFAGDDPLSVISQHLYAAPVPPRAYRSGLPPRLETLIVQLLCKQPEERPTDAAAVGRVLGEIVAEAQAGSAREIAGISASPEIGEAAERVPASVEAPALDYLARGRLVGRKHELTEASAVLRRAMAGEGQVLLVSGEPGIGKTRFVRELAAQAQLWKMRVLSGECYAEASAPYAPIARILEDLATSDAPALARLPSPMLAQLQELAPGLNVLGVDGAVWPPTVVSRNAGNPALTGSAATVGAAADASAAEVADASAKQTRLYDGFVSLCSALAGRAPLLLFVDDVHWADSGTLFLLRHLARRTRRLPLLIVMAYREEEIENSCCFEGILGDLNRERLSTRLKLSRLDAGETSGLMDAMLGEGLAPELVEGIFRETEGNPFFVEEIVKGLVEEGRLCYDCGHVQLDGSLAEVRLPQSVRQAVHARVGKLHASAQEVLQLAAIIGRSFDFETLQQAANQDEEALYEALETAERAQLIAATPKRGRGLGFVFVHGLIPAALVDGIGSLRRARLHRRVAEAITRLRATDYEALAFHWAEAHEPEQALAYYEKAGERALARYAYGEAESHYRAAQELAGEETDRAGAAVGLGEALFGLNRYDEAIQAWRAAAEFYRTAGEADTVAHLQARAARAAWWTGDHARCLALCRAGLSAVGEGRGPGRAELLGETGRACYLNGLPEEAATYCREALSLAEEMELVAVQAEVLVTLGILAVRAHAFAEARADYERAAALAEGAGLALAAGRAHHNLGLLCVTEDADLRGEGRHLGLAVEYARQAGSLTIELLETSALAHNLLMRGDLVGVEQMLPGMHELLARSNTRSANSEMVGQQVSFIETMLRRFRGELEEPARLLREIVDRRRERGDLQAVANYGASLAEILIELSEWQDAENILRESMRVAAQLRGAVEGRCVLAALLAQQGDTAEARTLLTEARERAGAPPAAQDAIRLAMAEAPVLLAEECYDEAWVVYRELAAALERAGRRWYWARTLREWAMALERRPGPDDHERARELLEQAKAAYREMGAQRYVEIVEELLTSGAGYTE